MLKEFEGRGKDKAGKLHGSVSSHKRQQFFKIHLLKTSC